MTEKKSAQVQRRTDKFKALDAGKTAKVQFSLNKQNDGLSFGVFDSISRSSNRQGKADTLWQNFSQPERPQNFWACPSEHCAVGLNRANFRVPLRVTTSREQVTSSRLKSLKVCQLQSSNTSKGVKKA